MILKLSNYIILNTKFTVWNEWIPEFVTDWLNESKKLMFNNSLERNQKNSFGSPYPSRHDWCTVVDVLLFLGNGSAMTSQSNVYIDGKLTDRSAILDKSEIYIYIYYI